MFDLLAGGFAHAAGADPDAPGNSYVLLAGAYGVLRGEVTDGIKEIVVIQRGGEIRLPKKRVACWSTDLSGLYQYQLDHRERADLGEHLRLAQWCLQNEYSWGAVREMAAATLLAPSDPRLAVLRQQLATLERAKREQAVDPESSSATVSEDRRDDDQAKIRLALAEELPPSRVLPEELVGEQLHVFTVSIQPLLNNRCAAAACHGGSSAIFRFEHTPAGSGRPTAAVTKENLASVLRWVDPQHPEASPLLVRATTKHGGQAEPALGVRDEEATARLRRWVDSVAAPHARKRPDGRLAATPPSAAGDRGGASPTAPVPLPHLDDPFDPAVFHRKVHGSEQR